MDQTLAQILTLSDECTARAQQLTVCLEEERRYLIEFRTEELLQNTSLKEELISQLQESKRKLRDLIRQRYGENVELDSMNGEGGPEWRRRWTEWVTTWEKLHRTCASNQDFLRHSLQNLDLMADNLKRLFHQQSLYNAKGNKVDSKGQGGVLETSL